MRTHDHTELDAHRTRVNRWPLGDADGVRFDAFRDGGADGSAYDYAAYRGAHLDADVLADGHVEPDLDVVADQLADAGPQFDAFLIVGRERPVVLVADQPDHVFVD
jgi:hypothetical protein